MKFEVIETRPAIQTWIYSIEAETEEEAIEQASSGKVEYAEYSVETEDDSDILNEENHYTANKIGV